MEKSISLRILKYKNIGDIIQKMEKYLFLFQSNKKYHHLIAFHKVYYLVTKTLQSYVVSGSFKNIPRMEDLDIRFADLYFLELENYLNSKPIQKPWQTYYKQVDEESDPFILILIGINAHINSDLFQVLIEKNYIEEDDYKLVNEILLKIIPEIMKYLFLQEKDIWGFGGLIFPQFAQYEFEQTIVKWRKKTWTNYLSIKNENINSKKIALENIHAQTENLAECIILEFENISKLKNIIKNFDQLNALCVRL